MAETIEAAEVIEQLREIILTCVYAAALAAIPFAAQTARHFFKRKTEHLLNLIKCGEMRQCYEELECVISAAVAHTNQCYVDELKKSDAFTNSCHKTAMDQTRRIILDALTPAAKKYFRENHRDLRTLLEIKIEEAVRRQKRKEG